MHVFYAQLSHLNSVKYEKRVELGELSLSTPQDFPRVEPPSSLLNSDLNATLPLPLRGTCCQCAHIWPHVARTSGLSVCGQPLNTPCAQEVADRLYVLLTQSIPLGPQDIGRTLQQPCGCFSRVPS
jgi:hypothetical protein